MPAKRKLRRLACAQTRIIERLRHEANRRDKEVGCESNGQERIAIDQEAHRRLHGAMARRQQSHHLQAYNLAQQWVAGWWALERFCLADKAGPLPDDSASAVDKHLAERRGSSA